MTFCRFGISPRTTSGRMTSSSAPFNPIMMTRGREVLLFAGASCAVANVVASASTQRPANENRRERRFTAGSSQWVVAVGPDKFNPKWLRNALSRETRYLFVAQSLDGVELRGPAGGIVAEEHTDAGGEKAADHEHRGRELGGEVEDALHHVGRKVAEGQAEGPADETKDDRFAQELELHVGFGRTHGETDADLARPLR